METSGAHAGYWCRVAITGFWSVPGASKKILKMGGTPSVLPAEARLNLSGFANDWIECAEF